MRLERVRPAFAQNRVAAPALSRKEREVQRVTRVTLTIAVLVGVCVWALLNALAPRSKPMVTVYAHADCNSCLRWMQHIAARRRTLSIRNRARSGHAALLTDECDG